MALAIDGTTYGINNLGGTSPLSSSNGGTGTLVTANANDWIIICGFLENEYEQGGYPHRPRASPVQPRRFRFCGT